MAYEGNNHCTKHQYKDEDAAQSAVVRLWLLGKITLAELDDLRPYHCPFCQVWHIGHRSTYEAAVDRGGR